MNDFANEYWDPSGEKVKFDSFLNEQQNLLAQYEKYRKNPSYFQNLLILFLVIPFALIIFMYLNHSFSVMIIGISFVPLLFLYSYVTKLQDKLIILILCNKYNWAYNPLEDYSKPKTFKNLFPNLFSFGNNQKFSEQIWGYFKQENVNTPFWSCYFEYTTGNRKSSQVWTDQIFILKLEKQLLANFTLETVFLSDLLTKDLFTKEIQTEYEDFNKKFLIKTEENDPQIKNKVIQILSPSVQTRLMDFINEYPTRIISFHNDLMIITLNGKIWKPKYTNFFKYFSLDPKDSDIFEDSLSKMIRIPSEMIKYI